VTNFVPSFFLTIDRVEIKRFAIKIMLQHVQVERRFLESLRRWKNGGK